MMNKALVLTLVIATSGEFLEAQTIAPGVDLLSHPQPDFANLPYRSRSTLETSFARNAFGSGSQPLTASVWLQGIPLAADPAAPVTVLNSDTVIERLETAELAGPGSSDTVACVLRGLRLESFAPLVVAFGGGHTEDWHVRVTLTDSANQVAGTMTIFQESAQGGTLDLSLPAELRVELERDDGLASTSFVIAETLTVQGVCWSLGAPSDSLGAIGAGGRVDGDHDGSFLDDPALPGTSSLFVTACDPDDFFEDVLHGSFGSPSLELGFRSAPVGMPVVFVETPTLCQSVSPASSSSFTVRVTAGFGEELSQSITSLGFGGIFSMGPSSQKTLVDPAAGIWEVSLTYQVPFDVPLGELAFVSLSIGDSALSSPGSTRVRSMICVGAGCCPDESDLVVANAEEYGCGVNPAESLVLVEGAGAIGSSFTVGLDNPLGTQAIGTSPFLVLSTGPAPGSPCGFPLSGFGMAGPGAPGQVLVNPGGILFVLPGPPWLGPGLPSWVDVELPLDAGLLGVHLYAQGLLIDLVAPFGVVFGLTEALDVQIGFQP